MLDIKDLVTLDDDNKYCVSSKATYKGDKYYLLVDINNFKNIKICCESIEEKGIALTEVEDSKLLVKLILLFNKSNREINKK